MVYVSKKKVNWLLLQKNKNLLTIFFYKIQTNLSKLTKKVYQKLALFSAKN